MLEFVEEALDEVAFAIQREVAMPRRFAIGFWGNHRGNASLRERIRQRIGVASLVAKQGTGIDTVDQLLCTNQIVGLSRRKHQFDRIAQGIDEGMDFGRQSSTGSADRLFAVFFRAPALC
jgi:hypothetical protein